MHSAATWFELAATSRAMADGLTEPADRRSLLDIAADYERLAHCDVTGIESARWFGACSFAARVVGIP
jgi:hypothetical protein